MKELLSKIFLPLALLSVLSLELVASRPDRAAMAQWNFGKTKDTVVYSIHGYRNGWDKNETVGGLKIADSLLNATSIGLDDESGMEEDSVSLRPVALDTLIAPDSLLETDPFLYKYYAAVKDSACHAWVRDTLIQAGDSLDYPRVDSLYFDDSLRVAVERFNLWYASLSKQERKAYDASVKEALKIARLDSLSAAKEEARSIKDSIIQNTPRIMNTYVFRDSLQFQRILKWTLDRDFQNLNLMGEDTSYNYRFRETPILREDAGIVWLGLSGTPAMYMDYSKRNSLEGVGFYDALESWSLNPSTIVNYNTKTPYTELAYWGTILAGQTKEYDNLHLLTSQNISPEFNFTLLYNRFGGEGFLANEKTKNKTAAVNVNYLGKKYLMHAGFISNRVAKSESGGILDNFWIRDTIVATREIDVRLQNASSDLKKKTLYLDQQFRIPFTFLERLKEKKDTLNSDETPLEEPEILEENEGEEEQIEEEQGPIIDTLVTDITTAFVGHSSEYSTYTRSYIDGSSNLNDSMRVAKFDNKFYIRLQPWSDKSAISKLDVGIGEKILSYYELKPGYIYKTSNARWTSSYIYGGGEGQIREFFRWDARAHFSFAGNEAGDFDLGGNLNFSFYPFRKARKSPLDINIHASTSLDEPEYYSQHLYTSGYKWDNEFGKISKTTIGGSISIPHWRMALDVNYNLLSGNTYYDTLGIIRQNSKAMSVLSASLKKEFVLGILHLDNRILCQLSSDQEVVPLPLLAVNGKYFVQFPIAKGILMMQLGGDIWYTTRWNMPGYNPNLGVFYNQNEEKYGECPYIDLFANMQWKKACLFVKYENAGMGWPLDRADYFSAHHYSNTQRILKIGIFWPFYSKPESKHSSAKAQ